MKIAVVDHIGNKGGLSRVIRKLLPEIAKMDEKIEIVYFGNKNSILRENLFNEFKNTKINIKFLNSLYFSYDYSERGYIRKILNKIQKLVFSKLNFLPSLLTGNLKDELEKKLKQFDFIYFPWPFLIELPNINIPMAATFHDFNYKYYFSGVSTYNHSQFKYLDENMKIWLKNVKIIVSNKFTASELRKFYSEIQQKDIEVIPLGAYSDKEFKNAIIEFNDIKKKFNLPKKYLFCGTNTCSHKNLNPLFAALNIVRSKGYDLNLVLTGPGTEIINGAVDHYGVQLINENQNVFGLGYVSNNELDIIIENSICVISPEMYTSDNGPATDGWIKGKPVIVADIPSNREHLSEQKVFAQLFNFRNPDDIAEKIINLMEDQEKYLNLAIQSKKEISKIEWKSVAKKYLEVFYKYEKTYKFKL